MLPSNIVGFLLISLIATAAGRTWRQLVSSNFIGEGTNDLTTSILQSSVEENSNYVFSPLGYSVILAILAEGSRGNTRNQLVNALRLPEDTFAVRNTYQKVLTNLQERGALNKPEFKNWFYVLKNYSVEQNYKDVLINNYLTEVKNIEHDVSSQSIEEPEDQFPENKRPEEQYPDTQISTTNKPSSSEEESSTTEGDSIEEVKEEQVFGMKMKEVTEKQTLKNVQRSRRESSLASMFSRAMKEKTEINKDILTALSANKLCSIVNKEKQKNPESKMIIFNGLYFRGNWSIPFALGSEEPEGLSFYVSNAEKKPTTMMYSQGEYDIGELTDLDSTAIELPYQGERYSLLVVLPHSRDGLPKLISDLTGYSFRNIDKYLSKKQTEVFLPKFKFHTISHPKDALIMSGINDIFNESADLSGITGQKGLYLDELVQLVTLEVDEGDAQTNFLTASRVLSRNNLSKFAANHPFLFFLRDRIDNLIVVAGKVTDPSIEN